MAAKCPNCGNTTFTGDDLGGVTRVADIYAVCCTRCGVAIGCYQSPIREQQVAKAIKAIARKLGVTVKLDPGGV
jgi:hypothetical protein